MYDVNETGVGVPRILLPDEKVNMRKWSVVACDQYVDDEDYWDSVDRMVGNSPSTLRMMLPEAYLSQKDIHERIEDTKDAMYDYIEQGVLKELPQGFMLVERFIRGNPRVGLMVMLDLEKYEFEPHAHPLIRPTEKTIKDRIPPRMQIRINAPVEMPHVLALIDDPDNTVIEPLYNRRNEYKKLYDFDLMMDGGRITGYFVDSEQAINGVLDAIDALPARDGMRICIGDGNHSLATAKEVWNRSKNSMSEKERAISPLRYVLCELINLHDPALDMLPIHRAITGINSSTGIQFVVDKLNQQGLGARLIYSRRRKIPGFGIDQQDSHAIFFNGKDCNGRIELSSLSGKLVLEDLQPVLEQLVEEIPQAKLEYLHGDMRIDEIASSYDTVCFVIPPIKKDEFMQTIIDCGVLPKKSFSLGEENEKRYYLESRLLIIPDGEAEEPPAEEEQYEPETDYTDDREYKHGADEDELGDEPVDDEFDAEFGDELSPAYNMRVTAERGKGDGSLGTGANEKISAAPSEELEEDVFEEAVTADSADGDTEYELFEASELHAAVPSSAAALGDIPKSKTVTELMSFDEPDFDIPVFETPEPITSGKKRTGRTKPGREKAAAADRYEEKAEPEAEQDEAPAFAGQPDEPETVCEVRDSETPDSLIDDIDLDGLFDTETTFKKPTLKARNHAVVPDEQAETEEHGTDATTDDLHAEQAIAEETVCIGDALTEQVSEVQPTAAECAAELDMDMDDDDFDGLLSMGSSFKKPSIKAKKPKNAEAGEPESISANAAEVSADNEDAATPAEAEPADEADAVPTASECADALDMDIDDKEFDGLLDVGASFKKATIKAGTKPTEAMYDDLDDFVSSYAAKDKTDKDLSDLIED